MPAHFLFFVLKINDFFSICCVADPVWRRRGSLLDGDAGAAAPDGSPTGSSDEDAKRCRLDQDKKDDKEDVVAPSWHQPEQPGEQQHEGRAGDSAPTWPPGQRRAPPNSSSFTLPSFIIPRACPPLRGGRMPERASGEKKAPAHVCACGGVRVCVGGVLDAPRVENGKMGRGPSQGKWTGIWTLHTMMMHQIVMAFPGGPSHPRAIVGLLACSDQKKEHIFFGEEATP